jgi:hypothetical protein
MARLERQQLISAWRNFWRDCRDSFLPLLINIHLTAVSLTEQLIAKDQHGRLREAPGFRVETMKAGRATAPNSR